MTRTFWVLHSSEEEEIMANEIFSICFNGEDAESICQFLNKKFKKEKCTMCKQLGCCVGFIEVDDIQKMDNLTKYMSIYLNQPLQQIRANTIYWTGLPEQKFEYSAICKNCNQNLCSSAEYFTIEKIFKYWCDRRRLKNKCACPSCGHIMSYFEFIKTSQ